MIRVGNEEYVRQNRSFGLTTMRNRHVDVAGTTLRFQFRGKSGKKHVVEVRDRRLARIVRRCREIPGHHLFEYLDAEGQTHTIGSGDVNDYLREITGQEFTAKDFRTWAGTLLAVAALRACGTCGTESERKKSIAQAIDRVRERLGNTRAVCRKYYVHPSVINAFMEGTLPAPCAVEVEGDAGTGLTPEERSVLAILQQQSSALPASPSSRHKQDTASSRSVETKLRRGSPDATRRRPLSVRIPRSSPLIPIQ
jgi:DNA topoisomerase I